MILCVISLFGFATALVPNSELDQNPTIIGGRYVRRPGMWPWQGSIEPPGVTEGGHHYCGAALIDDRHALTAAHCVDEYVFSHQLVLGMHDQFTRQMGDPTPYQISQVWIHENYVQNGTIGFPHDIAVMRLNTSANEASPYIRRVRPSPKDGHSYAGDRCYITGWGRSHDPNDEYGAPNILKQARMDVLTQTECIQKWESRINPGHICVFDKRRQRRGSCSGDSGGPLVCNRGGQWVLAGLTSWGRTGCRTEWPSVYSRVSHYYDWILDKVRRPFI